MAFLYNIIIWVYHFGIRVASLFNPKARLWVGGRKAQIPDLEKASRELGKESRLVWFHCASLGEFEQGRPVIEEFRKTWPEWKILLTFFSPSGYEVRKNYEGADYIFYLPADSPGEARKFVRQFSPKLVFFVKYEFWFNYLKTLKKEGIPVFVISANFRPGQHFFRWSGGWARKQLRNISHFFVQDESSVKLLKQIGIDSVSISGDTRFDRVSAIAGQSKEFPAISEFAGEEPVFLAGSTWPADEHIIRELIIKEEKNFKFILAPHEVHEEHLTDIEKLLSPYQPIRFSGINDTESGDSRVLIIDGIGYLSHLYKYARIAYIGGGFGIGIHNILEAATFGKPVIFGPKYDKFREARELVELGGAFVISNGEELLATVRKLMGDDALYSRTSAVCSDYIRTHQGATATILGEVRNIFPEMPGQ